MIAKTYKVEDTDVRRLAELLLEAEALVDGMDEAELDTAERQLAASLKGILEPSAGAPTLIFDRRPPRRSRLYAGGFALLAAAVTLMTFQPSLDLSYLSQDVYQGSKGGEAELASLPCQPEWIQSDRSTPEVQAGSELMIQPELATYLKIFCPIAEAYVHVSFEKSGERVWLVQNGRVNHEGSWLRMNGELVDFRAALGHRVHMQVSKEPIAPAAFSDQLSAIIWADSISLHPH